MMSRESPHLGPTFQAGWTGWGAGLATIFVAVMAQAESDDWPQFRGDEGTGTSVRSQLPAGWSIDRHLAWKVRIPGSGWSQPIVVGDLVFLTTAVSDHPTRPKDYSSGTADPHTVSGGKAPAPDATIEWKVLAIDPQSGKLRWECTVATGKPKYPIHPSNTYASETPAGDARAVYAWFGAAGTVAALDHAGHPLWRRELGVFRQQENLGTGSSPRLYQGLLYVQCFNEEQAFLVCLETQEGREKWRIQRDRPGTAWTTPLVWQNQARTELVVCGQRLITSHDPMTGRELWRGGGIEMAGPCSVTADRSRLYLGFRSALEKTKLYALNAGAEGDQSSAEASRKFRCEAWALPGAAPGMASPAVAEGCVYVVNDAVVSCRDAASGKEHFKERLPGFRRAVASPIVIGQQAIFLDESGSVAVLKTGSKFEIVGRSKFDDAFWASPAAARNALLLRGVDYLYCIRDRN